MTGQTEHIGHKRQSLPLDHKIVATVGDVPIVITHTCADGKLRVTVTAPLSVEISNPLAIENTTQLSESPQIIGRR